MSQHSPAPMRRFSAEELAARNAELGVDDTRWYSDDELDELEQQQPLLAARIAQRQAKISRLRGSVAPGEAPPLTHEGLTAILEEARVVLLRDGGDLELVDFTDTVVRVRLKGACTGCPNSVLDLKNVVETVVRRVYPQVTEVRNTY